MLSDDDDDDDVDDGDDDNGGGGGSSSSVTRGVVSSVASPARHPSLTSSEGARAAAVAAASQALDLIDPTPTIADLFMTFDAGFFGGTLAAHAVEVRWSPRMTLCAVVCEYHRTTGLCSVRLSTPLLRLRPRHDLVDTLLHEMTHAYLFVTDGNFDHDGHGAPFLAHAHRINRLAATSITVYHTFHDEVASYRTHVWRCNGPCVDTPPYHGWVRRAMNRPPGPSDWWWGEHAATCGGTYVKVSEPPPPPPPPPRAADVAAAAAAADAASTAASAACLHRFLAGSGSGGGDTGAPEAAAVVVDDDDDDDDAVVSP